MAGSGLSLHTSVLGGDLRVRPQVVPKRQMLADMRIADAKRMDVMRPPVAALRIVPPPWDAELATRFVPQVAHRSVERLQLRQAHHFEQQVDHRLRGEPRHGRAADVMSSDEDFSEDVAQLLDLVRCGHRPPRVVVDDAHVPHATPAPLPIVRHVFTRRRDATGQPLDQFVARQLEHLLRQPGRRGRAGQIELLRQH